MVRLFAGARQEKGYVIKSILLGIAFWLLQFAYQYYILGSGDINISIIRSSAFAGATLIGIALIIGPLATLWPTKNYVKHRRTFGVMGFTFIIMHYFSVMAYIFNFNLSLLLFSNNPYVNPVLFGLAAFWIYVPLYITSTDWATQKLGYKKWKMIHRLVYFAWILSVAHFILINPPALFNISGYLLLTVTALGFILEISALTQHVKTKGGQGKYIGILIILLGSVIFYFAYTTKQSTIVLYGVPILVGGFI